MASPFCTICERLGDSEGNLSCETFPQGIPEAVYPWGCTLRKPPHGTGGFGFKPKPGMEETARRWVEEGGQGHGAF